MKSVTIQPNPAMEYDPPLPGKADVDAGIPFVQTVRLREQAQVIGRAVWASSHEGVVQLLHLEIDPAHGRTGQGGRLMQEVIRQAQVYQGLIGVPLRRIWMMVEQKSQVIGRAFLTGQGFHHVGTMKGLYRRQDALMYLRAFN